MQTRDEHLAFCKKRALVYLERGDYLQAVASILSDLEKHPETKGTHNDVAYYGMMLAKDGNYRSLLQWIEGFR